MRSIYRIFVTLVLTFSFAFDTPAQKSSSADRQPTLILISIDGFRADYLDIHSPPELIKLAATGVRAKWLIPAFPTKTFPNHYTIATGLLPAHHGIIENNIFDPKTGLKFSLGDREQVENPFWWGGEPVWVTAEKQGVISAAYFFPGTETEIAGVRPSYWKSYDGKIPNETRIDTVLGWLDLPPDERPRLITTYFSDVDDAGHRYGPDSGQTKEAVETVDTAIKRLTDGLLARGIFEQVNIIIVSDHGMTSVPRRNAVILDEMFDTDHAEQIFWVSEFVQIFPKPGREDEIYNAIRSKLGKHASIYKKADLPGRFRYSDNPRIAPLIVLPKEGWRLLRRKDFDTAEKEGVLGQTGGSHGYDNRLKSMRGLFIGHGEAFKKGIVVKPFHNFEIYNLMCKILGLTPAKNDGDIKSVRKFLTTPSRHSN